MLVILSVIGMALALLITASVAVLLIRLIVAAVKAVALLALAGVIAVGLALLARAAGLSDGASVGLGLLLCPLAIGAEYALLQRRRTARHAAAALFQDEPALPAQKYAGPAEPKADRSVAVAWDQLADIIPKQRYDELHRARANCARLLAQESEAELDVEVIEARVLIRRSLPELAKRATAVWQEAGESERAEVADQVSSDICLFGNRASSQLQRRGDAIRDRLRVIRSHIGTRAGKA